MKRILLSLTLILTMTVLITNTVFSDESTVYTEDDFQYTIENGEIKIISYYGDKSVVTIPRTIGLYDVTSIGQGAFEGTNVKSINIPDTVDSIEDDSLKTVKINKYDIYTTPIEEETSNNNNPSINIEPNNNDIEVSKEDKQIEISINNETTDSTDFVEIEKIENDSDLINDATEEDTLSVEEDLKEQETIKYSNKVNVLTIIAITLTITIIIIGSIIIGRRLKSR